MDAKENDFNPIETLDVSDAKTLSVVQPIALTTIIFVTAALTIIVATKFLWPLPFGNGVRQVVLSIFNGMLLSLPVLVSLWMGLGRQTWIIRIPLATLYLATLLGVYLTTIKLLSSNIPSEIIWMFAAVTLGVTVSLQVPLWVVRIWRGMLISRTGSDSSAKTQFTIKQLMITTTVFAFLVPLMQSLSQFGDVKSGGGPAAGEIFGFCGVFIVVLMFLMLLSVLFVFSTTLKIRAACLCVLAVGITALPFAVVPSLIFMVPEFEGVSEMGMIDMGVNVFTFSLSNAVTMIIVLSMYHVIGFRLWSQQK